MFQHLITPYKDRANVDVIMDFNSVEETQEVLNKVRMKNYFRNINRARNESLWRSLLCRTVYGVPTSAIGYIELTLVAPTAESTRTIEQKDSLLWVGYSKRLGRVLRRDLNKSHLVRKIRLHKRCKTANLSFDSRQALGPV